MQAPLQRPATVLARPGPVLAPLREPPRPALVAEPESSHSSLDGPNQPAAAESLSTKHVSGAGSMQSTGELTESGVDPLAGALTEGHCYRWGLQSASCPLVCCSLFTSSACRDRVLKRFQRQPVPLQAVP